MANWYERGTEKLRKRGSRFTCAPELGGDYVPGKAIRFQIREQDRMIEEVRSMVDREIDSYKRNSSIRLTTDEELVKKYGETVTDRGLKKLDPRKFFLRKRALGR